MRYTKAQSNAIVDAIYGAICREDCTGKMLMEAGCTRVDITHGTKILLTEGRIYRYGRSIHTYYTLNKPLICESPYSKKVIPIVVPEQYKNDFALGMRMGYTALIPGKGRVFKGILHHD